MSSSLAGFRSRVAAVVLAGGTSRRLGGVDKATLVLDDLPLLDRVLAGAAGLETVVVGPRRPLHGDPAVTWTVEDPPRSGPLAGLAAGVLALSLDFLDLLSHVDGRLPEDIAARASHDARLAQRWVLALACDLPHAAAAVPVLLAATSAHPQADALVGQDIDGRAQPLLAAYRLGPLLEVLSEAGDLVGAPMRALLSQLDVVPVPLPAQTTQDVDTWQDAEALGVTAALQPDTCS